MHARGPFPFPWPPIRVTGSTSMHATKAIQRWRASCGLAETKIRPPRAEPRRKRNETTYVIERPATMQSISSGTGMSVEAPSALAPAISDRAWKAIESGFDLQVHVAPDVIARRIDDLDLAKEFLRYRLGGFVLKSHYIQTAERAKVVSKSVPGVSAFGALTLNHAVGGLNPVAVEIAGRSGAKIVWMPTVDAENETAGFRPISDHKKLPFWAEIQRELGDHGNHAAED